MPAGQRAGWPAGAYNGDMGSPSTRRLGGAASLAAVLVVATAPSCRCATHPERRDSALDLESAVDVVSLPRRPRPPLTSVAARAVGGRLATSTRLLLARTTARDGVHVLLQWEDPSGPLGPEHALGRQDVDWPATVGTLEPRVFAPGASEPVVLQVGGEQRKLRRRPLHEGAALQLSARAGGVQVGTILRPWRSPASDLFGIPGTYRVQLAGALVLADERVPFETAPLPVTVAADDGCQPLLELELIAAKAVQRARRLHDLPMADRATVDDTNGNRVVRFSPLFGSVRLMIEVVIGCDGNLVSVNEERYPADAADKDAWRWLWQRPGGVP
jgi:hypothetical protein